MPPINIKMCMIVLGGGVIQVDLSIGEGVLIQEKE